MSPPSEPEPAPGTRRPASSLLPRLLLLFAAPAVFLVALEGALRLSGYGSATAFFIPDESPGFYRTNPAFTSPFIPASFGIAPLNFRIRRHKEPGALRVFVLGESAAQGVPEPDFGFAAQLRAQLRARFPGRAVEVFNLGITAINSHVVYRIARQVAGFEPDLLVVYMGNNEVVGPYGPGCAYMSSTPPLWVIRSSVWVRCTRTGQLLASLLGRLAPGGARAQDWRGMETFSNDSVRGDDPRLEAVYRNLEANLQGIVDVAGRAGIRIVLSTVVANLRDSAPFISLHRADLSPQEEKSWKAAFDAGSVARDLGDARSAFLQYGEALRLDTRYAETHFRLGRLAEELGDAALARKRYTDALHWDALRFRPDPRINEIIRDVARGSAGGALLVDAARELGSDPGSSGPPSGREILFDHVHFNWEGNLRMARLLADGCARELPGGGAAAGGGLDADATASALGYTAEARLKMLQVVAQLTLRPPFTGQSTFTEDQAALKGEVEGASAQVATAASRTEALGVVDRALKRDPDNPALLVRLAGLESDSGGAERALSLLDRAAALLPRTAELPRRKAQILIRLQRYDEAEALLLGSLAMDRQYYNAAGTLVELWADARQFGKAEGFFARELARAPSNPYLRLEHADLLARAGDWEGAEREARRIWDGDPGGRPAMAALELLVRLLVQQHRQGAADELTLEARSFQGGDYFNNQRLVQIYTTRNDSSRVAESLQAMAASGPFDASQHVDLAHRFADLNRWQEMLDELAHAREVARIEGNAARIRAIGDIIAAYRQRFSAGQAR